MIPLLSQFGLAYPALLIVTPLIGAALYYGYRRHGRGRKVRVATLLLLQLLSQRTTARKKFTPPLRFFFELLLLILLLAGIAGFYRASEGSRVAVIIDTSLSTAASLSDQAQSPALEAIKRDAQQYLDGISSSSRAEVFVTSPNFRSLTSGLVSGGEGSRAVRALRSEFAPDNLEGALTRLASDTRYDHIEVFTDRQAVTDPRTASRRIAVHSAARESSRPSNIAITGVEVQSSSSQETSVVKVAIGGFTDRSTDADVIVDGIAPDGEIRAGLTRKRVSLAAASGSEVALALPRERFSAYRVRVETSRTSGAQIDQLVADNMAWISAQPATENIAVVSDLQPGQLGLERLKNFQFSAVGRDQIDRFTNADTAEGGARAVVYHRLVPRRLPQRNAFFILPPDSTLIHSQPEAADGSVTRWDQTHPVLDYLNLTALNLHVLTPIEVPSWATPLVTTTRGVILAAGEVGNFRYLIAGFEVFPYEGGKAPLLSIFTLNAMKWLSNSASSSSFRSLLDPLAITEDIVSVELLSGPSGEPRRALELTRGTPARLPLPGIYLVKKRGGESATIAADFLSDQESNIAAPRPLAIPSTEQGAQDLTSRTLFTGLIALIAAVLLVADLVWRLTRRRWAGLAEGAE